MSSGASCHICGALSLEIVEGFDSLCRVTSDCKPWSRGGSLSICHSCQCVQKIVNEEWRSEIRMIYENYSIYHQSDGVEQAVFDSQSGQSMTRSQRMLRALNDHIEINESGRLLDLGCGGGALLRAFSGFAPRWTLAGSELSERTRAVVESIERVEALYVGGPEDVPGVFDIVTMIHMLEHIPSPLDYLRRVRTKLKPGALLVIEIPNYLENPFDLLVADHASHFTDVTAAKLLQRAGYQVMFAATDWVPKELTLVARKGLPSDKPMRYTDAADPGVITRKMIGWLRATLNVASECAKSKNFGLFGTSIGATWLLAELGKSVTFFADEDRSRIGKTFAGRPVYYPNKIPDGGNVFLALPRKLAESVQSRVAKSGVSFVLPPILEI